MESLGTLNRMKSSRHGGFLHGRYYGCRVEGHAVRLLEITFGKKLRSRDVATGLVLPSSSALILPPTYFAFPFEDGLLFLHSSQSKFETVVYIDIFHGQQEPPTPLTTESLDVVRLTLSTTYLSGAPAGCSGVQYSHDKALICRSGHTYSLTVNLAEGKASLVGVGNDRSYADCPAFAAVRDRAPYIGFCPASQNGCSSTAAGQKLLLATLSSVGLRFSPHCRGEFPLGASAVMLTSKLAVIFGGGLKDKDSTFVGDTNLYVVCVTRRNRAAKVVLPAGEIRSSQYPILWVADGYLYIVSGYGELACYRFPLAELYTKVDNAFIAFSLQQAFPSRNFKGLPPSMFSSAFTTKYINKVRQQPPALL